MFQYVVALLALLVLFGIWLLKSSVHICGPGEILVIFGRSRSSGNRGRPYRLIAEGRVFSIPILEEVRRLSLEMSQITYTIRNARTKGGERVEVTGKMAFHLCGYEPYIHNAIERFLGVGREKLIQVVGASLEGNARDCIASLSLEELKEPSTFEAELLSSSASDFERLGVTIESLTKLELRDFNVEKKVIVSQIDNQPENSGTAAPIENIKAKMSIEQHQKRENPMVQTQFLLKEVGDLEFLVSEALEKALGMSPSDAESILIRAKQGEEVHLYASSEQEALALEELWKNSGATFEIRSKYEC